MPFWGEVDSIFAFFYMQVITMIFWIELDIICAFCVQVIYHGVLDCV